MLLGNSEFEFTKFDVLVGQTRIVLHIDRFDNCSTVLKDRGSQDSVFSGDSVAMQVCQFQKDRDEPACCEFIWVLSVQVRIIISTFSARKLYIVRAQGAASSHAVFHNTAYTK